MASRDSTARTMTIILGRMQLNNDRMIAMLQKHLFITRPNQVFDTLRGFTREARVIS